MSETQDKIITDDVLNPFTGDILVRRGEVVTRQMIIDCHQKSGVDTMEIDGISTIVLDKIKSNNLQPRYAIHF